MSRGTRPLGWLFNYFSRKPTGLSYELLETVQPVVDVAQDWPLPLTPYLNPIATGAGTNTVDITTTADKHRLWVHLSWSSPDVLVYQPAADGSFSAQLIISGAASPPILTRWTLTANAASTLIPAGEQMPVLGRMAGAINLVDTTTAGHVTNQLVKYPENVYQPPNTTLRLVWTQQTAAKTINLRGLFIERDTTSPLLWPF